MFIDLTAEQAELRDTLRSYFSGLLSPAERAALLTERHGAVYREVVRRMGRDGWLGVGWPTAYGGRGFGQVEQQIFVNEAARADIPLPAVTLQTVGPVLQEHGTPWQREFFLPRILAGEIHFAIGYTEPDAGTDLAALRTTGGAGRRGVRGQRPEDLHHRRPRGRLHLAGLPDRSGRAPAPGDLHPDRGTDDPGFSWTPIITHDGAHHVNATYYDHVRVPVTMRVGAENAGWRLITTPAQSRAGDARPGRPDRRDGRPGARVGRRAVAARRGRTCARALARASAVMRVNELLNWQVAATPELSIADASATKVFSAEQAQADRAVAGRGGGPARRRGRPRHGGAADLAGRPAQAEHRADVRRRRERDPARAHRHRRPRTAAGAAMRPATRMPETPST